MIYGLSVSQNQVFHKKILILMIFNSLAVFDPIFSILYSGKFIKKELHGSKNLSI